VGARLAFGSLWCCTLKRTKSRFRLSCKFNSRFSIFYIRQVRFNIICGTLTGSASKARRDRKVTRRGE
jgi:hypothetical protein